MVDRDVLEQLGQYFENAVTFSKHAKNRVQEVGEGRAVLYIDVEDVLLNGNGTLHGGVYSTLIDNAMALAILSVVPVRIATTQMNVHFLGPVSRGRVVCRSEIIHRTRRTATAEARVYDDAGTIVALGTGAFRIFEQSGNPIV